MTNVSNMYFGLSRLPPPSAPPRRSSRRSPERPGPLSEPPSRAHRLGRRIVVLPAAAVVAALAATVAAVPVRGIRAERRWRVGPLLVRRRRAVGRAARAGSRAWSVAAAVGRAWRTARPAGPGRSTSRGWGLAEGDGGRALPTAPVLAGAGRCGGAGRRHRCRVDRRVGLGRDDAVQGGRRVQRADRLSGCAVAAAGRRRRVVAGCGAGWRWRGAGRRAGGACCSGAGRGPGGAGLVRVLGVGRDAALVWRERGGGVTALRRARVDGAGRAALAVFRRADGDRDLDRAAHPAGERLGDRRAQPGLDDVAGERVGHGEQRGVLDDRAQPGQPEVGTLLGGDDLVR